MVEAVTSDSGVLAALPQLGADDLIPEITSLKLEASGRLVRVRRQAPVILTYRQLGRRVTGRFSLGAHPTLEIGCRLARIPYTVEGPLARDRLLMTVERIQKAGIGRLGITHRRELHIRDELALDGQALGAAELMHALVVAGLVLRPALCWLDALSLPHV